ncbi:signal peptidase I [bacterium]|jgi:signal peptidase I|nr:signal peptidase I [bacterium]
MRFEKLNELKRWFQKDRDSLAHLAVEYGIALFVAILIAIFIRSYLFEAYRIPSPAMRPTLEAGDTIFVAKWPYASGKSLPSYGEVVVFSSPEDPGRDFIKRVVGRPGDVIELKAGRLSINNKDITSAGDTRANCGKENPPRASYDICWEPPTLEDYGPEKVPEGFVFVLGDLRTQGKDLRRLRGWGLVPASAVKARALWIWLSIEPAGAGGSWFSRIRFERMFKRIQPREESGAKAT